MLNAKSKATAIVAFLQLAFLFMATPSATSGASGGEEAYSPEGCKEIIGNGAWREEFWTLRNEAETALIGEKSCILRALKNDVEGGSVLASAMGFLDLVAQVDFPLFLKLSARNAISGNRFVFRNFSVEFSEVSATYDRHFALAKANAHQKAGLAFFAANTGVGEIDYASFDRELIYLFDLFYPDPMPDWASKSNVCAELDCEKKNIDCVVSSAEEIKASWITFSGPQRLTNCSLSDHSVFLKLRVAGIIDGGCTAPFLYDFIQSTDGALNSLCVDAFKRYAERGSLPTSVEDQILMREWAASLK